jgi:formyl-CoA transferase
MALLHPQAANFFLNGRRPVPTGNPHPNIAPYEKYRTATCEIFIAIGNDVQFRKLCAAVGRPEIGADPRFLTNADRVKNRTAMIELLGATFAGQDGHALTRRLLDLGLPAGPVLAVDEAMAAPHTEARAMISELDGYRGLGTPIKFSRTPGGTRRRPPKFGEHAEELLRGCGYSGDEIAALRRSGVVHSERKR